MNSQVIKKVSGKGPINIALIKYWGKLDEEEIIPCNNSISITLDMSEHYTLTTCELKEGTIGKTSLILNGESHPINNRIEKLVRFFRDNCEDKYNSNCDLIITSKNTFPTGTGCASSASSMACLTKILSEVFTYKAKTNNINNELSALARQASGSASRSLHGGFVEWLQHDEAYNDSIAVQLFDEKHWEELKIILLIVSDKTKTFSSTKGMKLSKETSPFFQYRVNEIIPKRLIQMREAIKNKDFEALGKLTILDSNNFHAVCRDTYPTITYMNDCSNFITQCVEELNKDKFICSYTFDAGPNAFIFTKKNDEKNVLSHFEEAFKSNTYFKLKDIFTFNVGTGACIID